MWYVAQWKPPCHVERQRRAPAKVSVLPKTRTRLLEEEEARHGNNQRLVHFRSTNSQQPAMTSLNHNKIERRLMSLSSSKSPCAFEGSRCDLPCSVCSPFPRILFHGILLRCARDRPCGHRSARYGPEPCAACVRLRCVTPALRGPHLAQAKSRMP